MVVFPDLLIGFAKDTSLRKPESRNKCRIWKIGHEFLRQLIFEKH